MNLDEKTQAQIANLADDFQHSWHSDMSEALQHNGELVTLLAGQQAMVTLIAKTMVIYAEDRQRQALHNLFEGIMEETKIVRDMFNDYVKEQQNANKR